MTVWPLTKILSHFVLRQRWHHQRPSSSSETSLWNTSNLTRTYLNACHAYWLGGILFSFRLLWSGPLPPSYWITFWQRTCPQTWIPRTRCELHTDLSVSSRILQTLGSFIVEWGGQSICGAIQGWRARITIYSRRREKNGPSMIFLTKSISFAGFLTNQTIRILLNKSISIAQICFLHCLLQFILCVNHPNTHLNQQKCLNLLWDWYVNDF